MNPVLNLILIPSRSLAAITKKANGHYWTVGGDVDIRVHVGPRVEFFKPSMRTTMPGDEKTTGPSLYQLGPQRTTLVRYQDGIIAELLAEDRNCNQNKPFLP